MRYTKKTITCWLFAVFFTILTLAGCGSEEKVKNTESTTANCTVAPIDEEFFCHTLDQNEKLLEGYYRAKDGIWYLFVPSVQNISEMPLYYTGDIVAASVGNLDKETSVITHAFSENGDQVELMTQKGNKIKVVVMQSELPSVQIYLKGTSLETIHEDKDKKYKDNTVVITDPEESYVLAMEDSVEMKGRGNSSWRSYDKKGYQIKFDEKTSVLGMGKAKKWVLLANASDDSMIRTQLVYRMADKLDMAFVPSFEYVDFWVDGEYLGTYMIGEKVEIGGSRLDLEEDNGALFEHDESFYSDEDYWFYSELLQRHFVLKEISEEEDETIAEAMEYFETSVDGLTEYLYSEYSDDVTLEKMSELIDVDSFVKYYLVNEYVLNRESYSTSFYWYQDGPEDVLHLGPLWDFDTCMGNDSAAADSSYGENHILFRHLLTIPEFRSRVEELYAYYRDVFSAMKEDADTLKTTLCESADMNYLRWDTLGMDNPKSGGANFHNSYDEAVAAVKNWLKEREQHFRIPKTSVVINKVSEDGKTMEVSLVTDEKPQDVHFAVWHMEDSSDTAKWYTAEERDGIWKATVDLTEFGKAGLYRTDAHNLTKRTILATGCGFAKSIPEK